MKNLSFDGQGPRARMRMLHCSPELNINGRIIRSSSQTDMHQHSENVRKHHAKEIKSGNQHFVLVNPSSLSPS